MVEPHQLITPQGRRIAYHLSAGAGPGVVFLGGFKSDMGGAKAVHLDAWAPGRAYLRFDYLAERRQSNLDRFDIESSALTFQIGLGFVGNGNSKPGRGSW